MEEERLTCTLLEFAAMLGVGENRAREICMSAWHPPMVPAHVSGKGQFLIYRKGIERWLEKLCESDVPAVR